MDVPKHLTASVFCCKTFPTLFPIRPVPRALFTRSRKRATAFTVFFNLLNEQNPKPPALTDPSCSFFRHLRRLMATTSYPDTAAKNKGKMIAVQPQISDIASLKPTDSNKIIKAIVYRKWISKHGPWERTLENPTSLTFGKFISLQEIPNDDFPEHYFNFVSYNELATKLNVRNAVLTDYIGRVQAVSRLHTLGNATTNRNHRRIIDIQNLSGNIIRLTLWHEMALNFNLREYEAMKKPIVIAVRSCWVKQFNGLQLSGTSATHYYLNPNIPETYHIKEQIEFCSEACMNARVPGLFSLVLFEYPNDKGVVMP
ncbi:DNA helicase [Tanacetum coccineum]